MQNRTLPPMEIDPTAGYRAIVRTSRGEFTIELDPKAAPVTVNNFVQLARDHFYDGLTFHRVEKGFVVQGGDPEGSGRGGPGYRLPDETNHAPWNKGSVGMASSVAGVNGSQFFVLLGDAPGLAHTGVYNHFGMVSEGMQTVEAIHPGDTMATIEIVQ